MDNFDIARSLLNVKSAETSGSSQTRTITGVATSDSEDGTVMIDFGGESLSYSEEQSVEVATTQPVSKGDTVIVTLIGADGTAKSPIVTGIIGRGDEIYDAVDEAVTAATAAQIAANGKNHIFHQASAPDASSVSLIEGDTWFDTDDDYKMYMWDGSTWVAEQFGSEAIEDLAVTNAKIANGTIQSAKIAQLDAGKITSGTMSADRISGGTLMLGGDNNTDGVAEIYDANGNKISTLDKDGIQTTNLTATDSIYVDGDDSSYFKIPFAAESTQAVDYDPSGSGLITLASDVDGYMEISNDGIKNVMNANASDSGDAYSKVTKLQQQLNGSIQIRNDITKNGSVTGYNYSDFTIDGITIRGRNYDTNESWAALYKRNQILMTGFQWTSPTSNIAYNIFEATSGGITVGESIFSVTANALLIAALPSLLKRYTLSSKSAASATDIYWDPFTASVDGVFIGYARMRWTANASGRRVLSIMTKEGSSRSSTSMIYTVPASPSYVTDITIPILIDLSADQGISIDAYQNSGSSLTANGNLVGIYIPAA